jgi:hypothetical protein
MNAKNNGNKFRLSVQIVIGFFLGTFINFWLAIAITAIVCSVAEIARASGLENTMDSNHIQIARAVECNVNTIGMMSGEAISKMGMDR